MHDTHAWGTGEYNGEACSSGDRECYGCYCEALVFSSPLSDLRYCRGNVAAALRVHGGNAALLSVTAAVNFVLEAYSRWASVRELHSGRTRAQASMAQAQFVAQCLNTVVVAVRPHRVHPDAGVDTSQVVLIFGQVFLHSIAPRAPAKPYAPPRHY